MNTILKPRNLLLAASTACLLIAGPLAQNADASTTTSSSFVVTATVLSACIVIANPLAFGNYDPTIATPTDANTTVLVTCTFGTPYNVGLNTGPGTGATVATGKMTSGSNLLGYSLYQDVARTTVWGQTIGTDTMTGTGTGLPQTFNVRGRIPAQQTAPNGIYADTITVSVTY